MSNVKIPSSWSDKIVSVDTTKAYYLIMKKGEIDEEKFKVKLVLKKYNDGEGYGTECHYGYVFVVLKILKRYWNHPEPNSDWHIGTGPDFIGTSPDLCEYITRRRENVS